MTREAKADLDKVNASLENVDRLVGWHDAPGIHALMQKIDGKWMSATDPDDEYGYTPALPAQLLTWPMNEAQGFPAGSSVVSGSGTDN